MFAFYWWGALPGSFVLAAVPLPLVYLTFRTSESLPGPALGGSLVSKDRAPAPWRSVKLKHRRYGPLRALLWRQGPLTASGVFLCLTGLGIASGFSLSLSDSIAILWLLFPFLAICAAFPFAGESEKTEALYAFGMDLSRQARIRLWFIAGASTALAVLGLCSWAWWGEGKRGAVALVGMWALVAALGLSRILAIIVFATVLFAFPTFGFASLSFSWHVALASLCVLAAALLFRAALRASAEEMRLRERTFG